MVLKVFGFIVAAIAGYVLTVVAAFVYWDWIGASGPDYTPLLVVLFFIAPAVALLAGLFAVGVRPSRRRAPSPAPTHGAPVVARAPARRNGPVQYAIAFVVMALVVGFMVWMGDGPPLRIYFPR